MVRLKKSRVFKRDVRQDDAAELAIPTWQLVREAIEAGRDDEAFRLLDYYRTESEINNDSFVSGAEKTFTQLAGFGEEELEKYFRDKYSPQIRNLLSANPTVEDVLQWSTEMQRGHGAEMTVTEEPDRYVVKLDPCGTGGKLKRARSVGTTKQAHPWSWSKSGMAYYCCHCCFMWEILPIEMRGYPLRIVLPAARPEDSCTLLFYKKPELIPEEYFKRVGKTKTIK